jgi:hypothetical protein
MANWVDMLRCAHTADVHLGRAFGYLSEAAPGHQERLKRAFRRVFAEAQANECALVLIAGDLFDSPSVGREWVAFALATIADARLPTVVIPATMTLPSDTRFAILRFQATCTSSRRRGACA